jgi:hypothetical protein
MNRDSKLDTTLALVSPAALHLEQQQVAPDSNVTTSDMQLERPQLIST